MKGTGFGRGEGAACLLLKRMDDAIRDGDPIHALIRSSAWNHGGRSEGITMPSGIAHRKLLRAVHEAAGVDPSQTPVVEVCCPSPTMETWYPTMLNTKVQTRATEQAQRLGKLLGALRAAARRISA